MQPVANVRYRTMGTVLRADATELPDIKLNTIIDNSFQNSPVMASMPPSGLASLEKDMVAVRIAAY